jgi:hypothetical protein
MKKSRRDFIKTSTAIGMLGVTEASAQPVTPTAAKKIGFVVSTRDQPNHLLAFLQGLQSPTANGPGWGPTLSKKATLFWLSADGQYGSAHDELENHAKKHIRQHKVDMIVAAGGLTAAIAVAKALNAVAPTHFPFIYLIGRSPLAAETDAAAFFSSQHKSGGIDQNIPAQNEKSFQQMKDASKNVVTADTVGLIVNDNNAMSKPEVDLWTAQGHKPSLVFQVPGENDQQMSLLFQKIKQTNPQPTGIVVSSDPYFRSIGPEFDMNLRDASGGNFAGWVCYPYEDYLDQDPPANKQSIKSDYTPPLATDDPTDQKSAYYQLGIKAGTVLDALVTTPGSKPDVGILTWNGSDWGP